MIHSLLVPKISSLSSTNEITQWDNRPFISKWPEQDKTKKGVELSKTIKKKPKRFRTAFTTEQLKLLEKYFTENHYIGSKERYSISKMINVGEKQIKVWFQNRRMKEKRRSSESSSDSFSSVSSPPQLENTNPFTPSEDTSFNQISAINDYLQNTNEHVGSEYIIPTQDNQRAIINNMSDNGDYKESYYNNQLDYYNNIPTENNFGYAQNVNAESVAYYQHDPYYNHFENIPAPNWYEHNNYNTEYYDWQ